MTVIIILHILSDFNINHTENAAKTFKYREMANLISQGCKAYQCNFCCFKQLCVTNSMQEFSN